VGLKRLLRVLPLILGSKLLLLDRLNLDMHLYLIWVTRTGSRATAVSNASGSNTYVFAASIARSIAFIYAYASAYVATLDIDAFE